MPAVKTSWKQHSIMVEKLGACLLLGLKIGGISVNAFNEQVRFIHAHSQGAIVPHNAFVSLTSFEEFIDGGARSVLEFVGFFLW